MSDDKLNKEAAAAVDVPPSPVKKSLKEAVLEGLEEKGKGTDHWLW